MHINFEEWRKLRMTWLLGEVGNFENVLVRKKLHNWKIIGNLEIFWMIESLTGESKKVANKANVVYNANVVYITYRWYK